MAKTTKKKTAKKAVKKTTASRKQVTKKSTTRKAVKKRRAAASKVTKRRAAPKKTTKRKATLKKTAKRKAAPKKTTKRKAVLKKKKAAPKRKAALKKKKAAPKRKAALKKKKAAPKRKAALKKKRAAPKRKAAAGKTSRKAAAKVRTSAKRTQQATKKKVLRKSLKKTQARIVKPKVDSAKLKKAPIYQLKKGEDYMNSQQLEHFNTRLLGWKKELMKEVDRTVDHMQADVTNFADPADRATQEEEFGLELRTRDRERKLIKKIDESLSLIGIGDYGYCNLCGAEIGVRRLEARPTASLCIDCKTMQEVREKQVAD